MADTPIDDVSDTAYWVAHYRAVESARPDALFRDPYASRLAGERGAAIAGRMPAAAMTAWVVAMRTAVIDDLILSAVHRVDCVLNLGTGLDARPYRLDLPASLQWIEADYARIIDYKAACLSDDSPRCRLEREKIDLAQPAARRAFLAGVGARFGNVLVLTEGVVPYLDTAEAGELADDLRAQASFRGWIVDYFSREAMKFRRRHKLWKKMRNAPFRFDPGDDWFAFFRGHGWDAAQIRYLPDEGERHGRMPPFPPLSRALFRFFSLFAPAQRVRELRRFAGYVQLAPAAG